MTSPHIETALRLYGRAPMVTVLHPPVEVGGLWGGGGEDACGRG